MMELCCRSRLTNLNHLEINLHWKYHQIIQANIFNNDITFTKQLFYMIIISFHNNFNFYSSFSFFSLHLVISLLLILHTNKNILIPLKLLVSPIECYQCNASTGIECSDWLIGKPGGSLKPESCEHVHDAQYCIKTTALYGYGFK